MGQFDLEFVATDRTGNTTLADSADIAVPPPGSHPNTEAGRRSSANPDAHTDPDAGAHRHTDPRTDSHTDTYANP